MLVIGRLSEDVLEKTRLYSSETRTVFVVELRLDDSSIEMDVIGHLASFSLSG